MKTRMMIVALFLSALPAVLGAGEKAVPKGLEGGSPELMAVSAKVTTTKAPVEPAAEIAARVKAWQAARFGMFIHWGAYSPLAGEWKGVPIPRNGEWIQYHANVPNDEYAAAAKAFNPVKFNAAEWVAIAKAAGMKYIVITAKHHDGFALFPSLHSEFTLQKVTPFQRDPIKELADACREAGLGFGLYYSNDLDWHRSMWNNNNGVDLRRPPNRFYEATPGKSMGPDLARQDAAKFDDYYRHQAIPQVRELLTNYGPLISLFFDGNPIASTVEQGVAMRAMIRELQPQVVINNRLRSVPGDYFVYEQRVPPAADTQIWEGCMTMNGTWGFKKSDTNWKSTAQLIFTLVDIVSKGGNFLLNIGPTGEGIIPEASVTRLKEIGDWLKVNGDAIYGAQRTAFGAEYGTNDTVRKDKAGKPVFNAQRDWRCTTKPPSTGSGQAGKLYIHVFNWPATGKLELPAVTSKITGAYLLADPAHKPLDFKQTAETVSVSLPGTAPDVLGSVLCMDVTNSQ